MRLLGDLTEYLEHKNFRGIFYFLILKKLSTLQNGTLILDILRIFYFGSNFIKWFFTLFKYLGRMTVLILLRGSSNGSSSFS